jgi:hypothetical protein
MNTFNLHLLKVVFEEIVAVLERRHIVRNSVRKRRLGTRTVAGIRAVHSDGSMGRKSVLFAPCFGNI